MSTGEAAYKELESIFQGVYRLKHLFALADYDAQVYMPEKGAEARGAAISAIQQLIHERVASDTVHGLLAQLDEAASAGLDPIQRANVREIQREHQLACALPAAFVDEKASMMTDAQVEWRASKNTNDFQRFLPTLKKLVALYRREGAYLAAATADSHRAHGRAPNTAFEALMDFHEPGYTAAKLDAIFDDIKAWLPELLKKVVARRAEMPEIVPLVPPFARDAQEALGVTLMRDVFKFDVEAGRLDESAHPFTGNSKEDVRITCNIFAEEFYSSLLGVVHEVGHGLYEQNCGPLPFRGQPVCDVRSMGLHESQSLFQEFQVGRSFPFAEYLTPKLRDTYGDQAAFTPHNVAMLLQMVRPGFIRIDADEVSYPLHVILRYEVERDLMSGALEAEDVPRVWNEKMQSYLGLSTEGKDNLGCLQDIHWACGLFGYFPTYTLGAMFAAQLMATVKKELGEAAVVDAIQRGELDPILEKLNDKIWSKGRLYETDELMIRATGEPLNPRYFKEHLERRYLEQTF